jgi:hypothetical protein
MIPECCSVLHEYFSRVAQPACDPFQELRAAQPPLPVDI